MDSNEQIIIYTDGASRGNPGKGGYGVVLKFGNRHKELSQGYQHTTNNRMELLAVIAGLRALKTNQYPITIYTDSQYVVNSVEKKWVFNWVKTGFKDKKNADLWMQFLDLYKKFKIRFVWVKGHADNEWNNRCDMLATGAADGTNLLPDTGFQG